MTSQLNMQEIQHLMRMCDNMDFYLRDIPGKIVLYPNTEVWKEYNAQARWLFNTVEEALAFLEGFSARGLYNQISKGTKDADSRRSKKPSNTGRNKPKSVGASPRTGRGSKGNL